MNNSQNDLFIPSVGIAIPIVKTRLNRPLMLERPDESLLK